MGKTFSQKPADVTRKWYLIDASEAPLGRVATVAASLLLGKGKPTVTSHVDGGDYVFIINTDKLVVTGGKMQKKNYYSYSGYPGGLRQRTLEKQMSIKSEEPLIKAIRGMLPVNKLRAGRLERLKVYAGETHNHDAQKPEKLTLKETK